MSMVRHAYRTRQDFAGPREGAGGDRKEGQSRRQSNRWDRISSDIVFKNGGNRRPAEATQVETIFGTARDPLRWRRTSSRRGKRVFIRIAIGTGEDMRKNDLTIKAFVSPPQGHECLRDCLRR